MRLVGRLAAALGLACVGVGIGLMVFMHTSVPQWDIIDFYFSYFQAGGLEGYGFNQLYFHHNEHRLVVPRLWFLLDVVVSSGRQSLLLVVIAASALLHAALVVWLFKTLGASRPAVLVAFAVVAGAFLSPIQYENLLNGFQVQFIQVWLFATLSFALIAAAPLEPERRLTLGACVVGAVIAALLSTYSMVNGMAVWPILIIFAFWRRLPIVWTLFILVVGVTILWIEISGFRSTPGHGNPLDSLAQPIEVVRYLGRYLASGMRGLGTIAQEALGILSAAAVIFLGIKALMRPSSTSPARMALLATCAFILAAGLMTALGRLSFGLGSANSSRYSTPSMVFMAIVGLMAYDYVSRHAGPRLRIAAIGIGATVLLVPGLATGIWEIPNRLIERDRARMAIVSHLAGGLRADTLRLIYPHWPAHPYRVLESLRAAEMGPFSIETQFRPPATAMTNATSPSLVCEGSVDRFEADPVNGVVAEGWLREVDTHKQPLWVVFRTQSGKAIAWGASLKDRPDVRVVTEPGFLARVFLVFGPAPPSTIHDAGQEVIVDGVFEDGRVCRFGRTATPAPPRFVDVLPDDAEPALSEDWQINRAAQPGETGSAVPPPAALPVHGSIGHENRAFVATATLGDPGSASALAIPLVTEAHPFRVVATLLGADGEKVDEFVIDRPTQDAWRWLIFRNDAFEPGMTLEIRSRTSHAENGVGFGTPAWLP